MGWTDDIGWDWDNAVHGGGQGAIVGTQVFPGWGTAIGAGGGFLRGGLGIGPKANGSDGQKEDYKAQLQALAAGYGSRTAPQAGPASQAQLSQFRANQAGLISQLEAMARGQGPSAAQNMMREAMDRAAGSQASAAAGAGGRGVNAGAALRNAANNTAAIQAQGARDTGLMRVQEQLGATQQLGQTIAQGRAGDENMNQFNANAQNQMAQANLQAQLQALGINTDAQLRALLGILQHGNASPQQQLLAGVANAAPFLAQAFGSKTGGGGPTGDQAISGAGPYATPGSPGIQNPWG